MNIGTPVKIVADDKPNSSLIGKVGVVVAFKWNKFRQEQNLPVIKLDDGREVSGVSLWFEPLEYLDVLKKLNSTQIQELLKENFGETNFKYHTLDELSLNKLIAKGVA